MISFMKIFVLCTFCAFITSVEAHILIDIDPTELQSIGEVLVESYMNHNLIQRKVTVLRTIFSHVSKFSVGVLQMLGVTTSLIAANIFTPWFQTKPQPVSIESYAQVSQNISKFKPSHKCPHDFGCDRNVCYRSCGNNVKTTTSFCFTAPNANSRKLTHCVNNYDCSPCWSCIGVCHTPKA